MARDHARIKLHMWTGNDDFRALSMAAKLVYHQLLAQQKLTYAGTLDIAVTRWARAHPDLDATGVENALAELENARFVVIDQDTDELLVRTFIRNDELYKQPNVLRAALRQAFDIESQVLRAALAIELRRLPVDVTGPAPGQAADELESGARELSPSVKAAMAARGGRSNAGIPAVKVTPSANPGPNPSANTRGEGSTEQGDGELPVTSRSEKVVVPARAHTREDEPRPSATTRQSRRADARRLVQTHTPPQPAQVLERLTTEAVRLLADGVDGAMIAAGLRTWSAKRLTTSLLPQLVGEHMRSHVVLGSSPARLETEALTAATWERVRASAIESGDESPVGNAVRAELQPHTTPEELDALLREAGNQALASRA